MEDSANPPEKLSLSLISPKRKRVIEELVNGRESANQLQILLLQRHRRQQPQPFEVAHGNSNGSSSSAEELVMKILGSFTQTLSVLSSCADLMGTSTCSGGITSQDSGQSPKTTPAPVKDRRGHYKRRNNLDSWMTVSPTTEDGYAWRKYGQKGILNARYQRCYFRCTHKHDQGCKAHKQVQRTEDDPNMYQIVYFGHHTCKTNKILPVITDYSDSKPAAGYSDSTLISFKSQSPTSSTIFPLVKKELKEESKQVHGRGLYTNSVPALDPSLWQDYDQDVVSTSVYSCPSTSTTTTSRGLDLEDDMDTLITSVGFDSDFEIDFF